MLQSLKSRADLHIARKIFHMTSLISILLCMVLLPTWLCWTIYGAVGAPLLFLDLSRSRFPKVNRFLLKLTGPIVRKHEVRSLTGASYAIIGVGVVYWIFPNPVAYLAVLFLAIGDPAASLFGLLYGRIKLVGEKSLAGFVAAFFFCFLGALCFFQLTAVFKIPAMTQSVGLSLVCGLIGALSELIDLRVDDNLSQPVISSALLLILFSLSGDLYYG